MNLSLYVENTSPVLTNKVLKGNQMHYDVIVIGAGPAGCTASKILASNGIRTLLVERHKLPRYKSCSGVLIKKTVELTERIFEEKIPASAACAPTENHGMIFTDDSGREYRFEQEGLNVWRSSFDNWLAEAAADSGAELLDSCAAVSVTQDQTFVGASLKNGANITASYAIICEGAAGRIRTSLTGERHEFITTYQTFNRGVSDLDPHYFYAYLQPELSEYDAWFNVKDNLLVLGVSVRDISKISFYYQKFVEYMAVHNGLRISEFVKDEKWIMPLIKPGSKIELGSGRILFAGEAAGFLNPMGEGISSAVESGVCAACSVIEGFSKPLDVLHRYKDKTENLSAYMKRQWNFLGSISRKFKMQDFN